MDGLTRNVTKEHLHEVFSACGEVKSIHMAPIRGHLRSRGYAFVEYLLPAEAENALQNLNGGKLFSLGLHSSRYLQSLERELSHCDIRAQLLKAFLALKACLEVNSSVLQFYNQIH